MSDENLSEEILAAAAMPMPFGKFKGRRLIDLPEPYIIWFKGQGSQWLGKTPATAA